MKKVLLLTCLLAFSCAYSMEDWPKHCKNLWCPEMSQPIDAEDLLNHPDNAFWKQLSETDDQEQKDNYLQEALKLPGGDPVYKHKRKALACAVAAGADPNTYARYTFIFDMEKLDASGTVLHYLVMHDDYYAAQLALQRKANPNLIDKPYAEISLFKATTKKMAQLLIEYKANPQHIAAFDYSLLHCLVSHNRPNKLFKYCIQQSADVNHKDELNQTPLIKTILSEPFDIEKVKLLLENKALLDIPNIYQKTFLDLAKEKLKPEQYEEVKKVVKPYQEGKLRPLKLLGNLRLFISKQKQSP